MALPYPTVVLKHHYSNVCFFVLFQWRQVALPYPTVVLKHHYSNVCFFACCSRRMTLRPSAVLQHHYSCMRLMFHSVSMHGITFTCCFKTQPFSWVLPVSVGKRCYRIHLLCGNIATLMTVLETTLLRNAPMLGLR